MSETKFKTAYELAGFDHNKGWDHISSAAVKLLEHLGCTIFQVKEKFGGLRIYYAAPDSLRSLDDGIRYIVRGAEQEASETCEDCGKREYDWETNQWKAHIRPASYIQTLCDKCYKAKYEPNKPDPAE